MTKVKHTETPWTVSANTIRAQSSLLLATIKEHLESNNVPQQANAEFIVRAVNNHELLLEACKEAKYNLSRRSETSQKWSINDQKVFELLEQAIQQAESGGL